MVFNKHGKNIYRFLIVISLFTAVFNLVKYINESTILGFILIPIFYSLFLFLSKRNYRNFGKYGYFIINGIMFIRYSLIYLFADKIYIIEAFYHRNTSTQVLLILIEMSAVFLAINIVTEKKDIRLIDWNYKLSYPLFSIFLFSLIAFILYPEVSISLIIPNYNNVLSNVSSTSGVIIFVTMSIDLMFIIIFSLIRKFEKISLSFRFILSIILAGLFMSTKWTSTGGNVSRWIFLIYGFVLLFLLIRAYPRFKMIILVMSSLLILMGIPLLTIVKFNNLQNPLVTLFDSYTLDLYFGGPIGILNGINMSSIYHNEISFMRMLTDMFSAIPYMSSFFDGKTGTSVYLYHQYLGTTDKIIPLIVQSYIYLSIFGSFIFSFLITILVLKISQKIDNIENIYLYFSVLSLLVWISLFMALNLNILQEGLWRRLIFIFIAYLGIKFVNKKKGDNSYEDI
jgi:hypothetical protein